MEILKQGFSVASYVIEAAGVSVILAGCLLATVGYLREWRPLGAEAAFQGFRRRLGQAILLGLEFLIAGDIIQTVVVSQTLESAAVLAIVVLIRTFLSLSLEHSIKGRWPWQGAPEEQAGGRDDRR